MRAAVNKAGPQTAGIVNEFRPVRSVEKIVAMHGAGPSEVSFRR